MECVLDLCSFLIDLFIGDRNVFIGTDDCVAIRVRVLNREIHLQFVEFFNINCLWWWWLMFTSILLCLMYRYRGSHVAWCDWSVESKLMGDRRAYEDWLVALFAKDNWNVVVHGKGSNNVFVFLQIRNWVALNTLEQYWWGLDKDERTNKTNTFHGLPYLLEYPERWPPSFCLHCLRLLDRKQGWIMRDGWGKGN